MVISSIALLPLFYWGSYRKESTYGGDALFSKGALVNLMQISYKNRCFSFALGSAHVKFEYTYIVVLFDGPGWQSDL